jgi:hypothetical protein
MLFLSTLMFGKPPLITANFPQEDLADQKIGFYTQTCSMLAWKVATPHHSYLKS